MSMKWEGKDFGISFFQTLLFLIEVILPGLCAYVVAVIEISDVADHIYLFSEVVLRGAGAFSGLARHFFLDAFSLILLLRVVLTQIYSTMLVISCATLCRTGLFRARTKAILAGQRKPTLHATIFFFFFFVAVIPAAFRLLHVLREHERPLMLLGVGALYLVGTVGIAVDFHLDCGVQVRRSFGTMRRRLPLVSDNNLRAARAIFPRLIGIFVTAAVLLMAFPSQGVAVGTAANAVVTVVVMVINVTQPVVYLVLWDNYYSYKHATSLPTGGTGDNTSGGLMSTATMEWRWSLS
jgi:hypothetical protein